MGRQTARQIVCVIVQVMSWAHPVVIQQNPPALLEAEDESLEEVEEYREEGREECREEGEDDTLLVP